MCAYHGSEAEPPNSTEAPTPAATALDHVGLSVRDLEPAVAFYRNAFALQEEFRFTVDAAGPMTAVILRSADGWAVELLHRPDSADPQQRYAQPDEAVRMRGYHHLCVRVQDLESAYRRLVDAGASVVVPPSPAPHPAVQYSYVADPEGNLLELMHVRADALLGAPA